MIAPESLEAFESIRDAFTLLGSLVAHYWSLKNEKGKAAVGANKKYAQIPVEEWEQVKAAALVGASH